MEKGKEQYQKLSDELRHCIWNFPFDFRQKFEDALAHDFPIDFQDENGWTLLLESVWDKDATKAGVTGILLDYGANPNLENKLKYRPLDVAIYRQCPLELVYRLIKVGANVNSQDCSGKTAFSYAAGQYIYSDCKQKHKYGFTAAQFLLEHRANPYLNNKWTEIRDSDTKVIREKRNKLIELCNTYLTTNELISLY